MARASRNDPLQNHHFAMLDVPTASVIPTVFGTKAAQSPLQKGSYVGFQTITLPEQTLAVRDIKEGNWPITHSVYAGQYTAGDVTITQAVMPVNLDMYVWFLQGLWGRIAPRRHFVIVQMRADKAIPARLIFLESCLITNYKLGSDLDASSGEVSIEEMTMKVDRVEILPNPIDQAL